VQIVIISWPSHVSPSSHGSTKAEISLNQRIYKFLEHIENFLLTYRLIELRGINGPLLPSIKCYEHEFLVEVSVSTNRKITIYLRSLLGKTKYVPASFIRQVIVMSFQLCQTILKLPRTNLSSIVGKFKHYLLRMFAASCGILASLSTTSSR
jgi:hypothetical protein